MQTTRRGAIALGIATAGLTAGCLGRSLDPFSEASESTERGFAASEVERVSVVNAVGDVSLRAIARGA